MIDLYKYSKKNKLFNFLINKIFKINTQEISSPIYYKTENIDLGFQENFFYEYKKKFPITKWGGIHKKEHYQSNHDLQKLKELKNSITKLENYLNTIIKKKIMGIQFLGRFRIKSLWFTIQKKNQGHTLHNHPKSLLSGVYYFSAESDKGGEIEIFLGQKKIEHSPRKNDLLVFNSNIYHSVKPYHGDKDRIAVAWDAIYTF